MCVRSFPSFEAVRKDPRRTCNAAQALRIKEPQTGYANSCKLPRNGQMDCCLLAPGSSISSCYTQHEIRPDND